MLTFGALGAVIITAFAYLFMDRIMSLPDSNSAILADSSSMTLACVGMVVMFGTPAVMGWLTAGATGFAFSGGMAGTGSYVGYGIARAILDPMLLHSTWNPLAADAYFNLGCLALAGFVLGAIGGMAGRGNYEPPKPIREPAFLPVPPSMPYMPLDPRWYGGTPAGAADHPPAGPWGAPPPAPTDYVPARYPFASRAPTYQPGSVTSYSGHAWPVPNLPADGSGASGTSNAGDAGMDAESAQGD